MSFLNQFCKIFPSLADHRTLPLPGAVHGDEFPSDQQLRQGCSDGVSRSAPTISQSTIIQCFFEKYLFNFLEFFTISYLKRKQYFIRC
jgi:hypothetical protein